jgi:hypothetical protein
MELLPTTSVAAHAYVAVVILDVTSWHCVPQVTAGGLGYQGDLTRNMGKQTVCLWEVKSLLRKIPWPI